MREKLPLLATVFGVVPSVISAFAMRDHVRTVDIVTLFFGGVAGSRFRSPHRESVDILRRSSPPGANCTQRGGDLRPLGGSELRPCLYTPDLVHDETGIAATEASDYL
jgi:hypothetical protein